MRDLFFNELSIDSRFIESSNSRDNAKKKLLQFVRTCLAYIVCCGVGEDIVMSSRNSLGPFLGISLLDGVVIGVLLKELEEEDLLSNEEFLRFRAFTSESFSENWNPEYFYKDEQVYGLGEALNQDSYAVSFCSRDFQLPDIKLLRRSAVSDDENLNVMNLSSNIQVIKEREIWNDCLYINKVNSESILPFCDFSKYIFEVFGYLTIQNLYSNLANKSAQIKKLGIIIARINGWKEYCGCQNSSRLRFESNGYYITVDSQHAAFEVYSSLNSHLGEIIFYKNEINTSKKDSKRTVCD